MDKQAGRDFLLLLDNVFRWCRQDYFLIQGTALGAYRDAGFVPDELDIDLGILDYIPGRLVAHLVDAGVEVTTWHRHYMRCHTVTTRWNGVTADVVGWLKNKGQRYAVAPWDTDVTPHFCHVHKAALLETYQVVTLFGRRFNVPSPIEEYLETEYGPDWRTPRKEHSYRVRVYDYLRDPC